MSFRVPAVVLGIGMSSRATADEVVGLVHAALRDRCLQLSDVAMVATRERFVEDIRLDLGLPVVGVADDLLESATSPCDRSIGIRASGRNRGVADRIDARARSAAGPRATFDACHGRSRLALQRRVMTDAGGAMTSWAPGQATQTC